MCSTPRTSSFTPAGMIQAFAQAEMTLSIIRLFGSNLATTSAAVAQTIVATRPDSRVSPVRTTSMIGRIRADVSHPALAWTDVPSGRMSDKPGLREAARRIPPPTSEEAEAVIAGVEEWMEGNRPVVALGFLAMPSELDLSPLVDAHPEVRWAVTRTTPGGILTVHPYEAPMETHPFGFRQPVATAERIAPTAVDLVLVPGLLFDERGGRLGHGAGYYDRFLPRLRQDAVTMGVTVERRVVDEVPMDSHDVRLRWLATDAGVRRCRWPGGDEPAPSSGSG